MASLSKGTRPSFDTAATPQAAKAMFDSFVEAVKTIHPRVATGLFQSDMVVALENDGPVTFVIEEP